eukprot:13750009-Alexandrium_andersonii.AAC.1
MCRYLCRYLRHQPWIRSRFTLPVPRRDALTLPCLRSCSLSPTSPLSPAGFPCPACRPAVASSCAPAAPPSGCNRSRRRR